MIDTIETTVSRTMRAAIRVGEDFYTVEETVTLPINATDDDIAQAVSLGERIYLAQRAAAEVQVRELREQVVAAPLPIQIREPDAPASDKQRQYMDYLVNELQFDGARLQAFAAERKLDILTLTKREASELIDDLKHLLDERKNGTANVPVAEAPASQPAKLTSVGERATARQVKALERLADERGLEMHDELAHSYDGRALSELTLDEAGQLLSEWQQRPRQLRPAHKNGERRAA